MHPGWEFRRTNHERPIRVLSGALDELTEGQIVLRGVIDPASFRGLLKPDYQRETLRESTIEGLMKAFRDGTGRVPDVELAIRGEALRMHRLRWDVHHHRRCVHHRFALGADNRIEADILLIDEVSMVDVTAGFRQLFQAIDLQRQPWCWSGITTSCRRWAPVISCGIS